MLPSASSPAPILRFERFELRPQQRQLLVDGQPAELGARAFDVLQALAERAGRLVSKNELLDLVWPDVVVEENNLQVQISGLRKLLGTGLIATIPGRGYRFTAPLQADAVAPAAGAGADTTAAAAASPAPAADTLSKLRTNLPEVLAPLIGREDDLAAVEALIRDHRLVSLVGAGGVGKTRLAQALLAGRRQGYEHGVCFVELAPTAEPDALPRAIGAALGVNIGSSGEAVGRLVSALAPLSVLVALDNAEHLVEAAASVAAAILAGAPQVRLLVTSQVPLRLPAERVYRLGALAVPERTMGAQEALAFGAVALFAERAQAADRRFTLTDANVATVIELCRRLDGMALAIELAAARVPLLGLARLTASLDQRLRLLTTGDRTAPDRQRTLRAALEWSHGLLDDAQRTVFRRMAIFVGSASLESAQRVLADEAPGGLDEWAVLDALGGLVDRSLVEAIADRADRVDPADESAAPRYRLLDTPLEYARELLRAAGEEETLRRRHAQAMRSRFERAYDDLWSGRVGVDAWEEQLRPDIGNGRAAVAWALSQDVETAVAITVALGRAMSSSLPRECVALRDAMERLFDAPAASSLPPLLVARAGLECAAFDTTTRPKQALLRARQALPPLRGVADQLECYRALAQIALASALCGDLESAQAAADEMDRILVKKWPPVVRRWGPHARSAICHFKGDEPQAVEWLRRLLEMDRASGMGNSIALNNLAYVALAVGHVDEAVASGRALIEALSGTRRQWTLAIARINLMAALLEKDEAAEARAIAAQCWPQAELYDVRAEMADYLALLAALEHRPRSALRLAGYSDAAYAARDATRQDIEQRAVQRAERLARAQLAAGLDDAACDRLKAAGAALGLEEIAAAAFGTADTP
jgi:predicted ATPase/DNA-binding winged helix-turn-helix (wHTH) protein